MEKVFLIKNRVVIEHKNYACNNYDEVTKEFNDHLWKTKLLNSVLIAFRL